MNVKHNMNEILKRQELRERILHEIDILQFIDILEMSYEEVVTTLLDSASEEQREQIERYFLSC